jgi:hypothetical protein
VCYRTSTRRKNFSRIRITTSFPQLNCDVLLYSKKKAPPCLF